MLEILLVNLSAKTRRDTLEGRQYIVAPMVMLTEGVHAGSGGPLYYPRDELAKTPSTWNHKPIIVYDSDHPKVNGKPISACSREIIESHKVGVIMNALYDNKLRAEAWLDVEKLGQVSPETLSAIEAGQMVEISTGLFTDNEEKAGEFNGKPYVAIAKNYRPDHLAILPNGTGACSIADGAGLLQTNAAEVSYGQVYNLLCEALAAKFGEPGKYWDGRVVDIYPSRVIFANDGDLYSIDYEVKNGSASFSGDAVEVVRSTQYVTSTGESMGAVVNSAQKQEPDMTKEQKVANLITANVGWAEADKAMLLALDEKAIDRIVANTVKEEKKEVPAVNKETPVPAPAPTPPVPAVPPPALTTEQFIANAPADIQRVLMHGLQAHNAEKARLIALITTNANNKFDPAFLNQQDIPVLAAMVALTGTQQTSALLPNYSGQAVPAPTVNTVPQEGLTLPSMDWTQK